ncbi:RagB/SusD family nutrient uptake outer membrane protein [Dysgonomonas reticulitermitis]
MKKILLYAIFTSLIFSMVSCNDFLEQTPSDGFTSNAVYSSETEIKSAITGIYSLMTGDNVYGSRFTYVFNPNTDVEMAGITTSAVSVNGGDLACYEPKPYWTTLNDTWNSMYQIINLANDVIEGIEGSDLYKNADKTKTSSIVQLYGEAKTLRAMLYLDLIRIWGDVIFRTKSSYANEDFYVSVTDRNEILEYLIEDLKSVEPVMSYAADLDYGVERASREFCQGLIGLLAMNRGGWTLRPDISNAASIGYMERGENYQHYYDIAIEYLGKVINEGKHDLSMSFEELWYQQCNWNTPNNDDILFSIAMLKGTSSEFGYYLGIPITAGDHSYGGASGSLNFCGTYLFSFDKNDLRRDITCAPYRYNEFLNQEIRLDIATLPTGKWSKLKMDAPMGSTSTKGTGINYTWMRFADVLLLYAEAVNERYGPRDDAKDCLKRVRRRAFNSSLWGAKVESYVDNLGSKDQFFEAIVDERKWEFGGESIRKFDLARWNKFSDVIYNLYNDLITWGKVANGAFDPVITDVPASVYYKSVTDPEHSDRTVLDIAGIDEYIHAKPSGYTEHMFASKWYTLDNATESYEPITAIRWSFRGFINYNNASMVKPTDPLRYLCPYPTQVITDHRGKIQNYYGFNY